VQAKLQSSATTSRRALSEQMLERCKRSVAGGDSSTMRVLPYHPAIVAERGEGCRIWDVDGNEYFDLNMAYGPLLFGHRPRFVVDAVVRQLETRGSQLGFPQELTYLAAEKIQRLFPGMELLRYANSGTEANASATRLARTVTGRDGLVLFEGHYHGWSDAVFHRYHAPLEALPEEPGSPVIPGTTGMDGAPRHAYLARWNDIDSLKAALDRHPGEIAAALMEPVMGNGGVVAPRPGYLQAVRELTRERGVLLIFDEVITGLRVAAGGAQQLYGVTPDITVISKVLGSGFPIAAFGASAEMMNVIAAGKLFHGGVYSGNALVLSAANAVLTHVLAEGHAIYPSLSLAADRFARALRGIFTHLRIPHLVQNVGAMLSLFLTNRDVEALHDYREVRRNCDFEKYIRLEHALADRGVYVHPNQFEPWFLSTAHTQPDLDETLSRIEDAARIIA
jgi:glutamate-1-semialdehyde 2,1-aminomutase